MNYGAAVPTLVCLPICLFIYSRRRSCALAAPNVAGGNVAGGKPVNYKALANVTSSIRTTPSPLVTPLISLTFPTPVLKRGCH